ncbi:hypothetical protein [Vulgatibacter incomptus]|uniref:hypothetical protein n=1 Tax=Vulgatibacter incomptus TaxID=1391653 RepID=UPI000680B1C0|nr:hypothetical protein [Vulgatibacter incomptus]
MKLLGLVVVSLAFTACIPTAFRPARTVPQGEVEHTIGAHVLRFDAEKFCEKCELAEAFNFPTPSYTMRYGAARGLDIGLGYSMPGALSLDATIELVRTPGIDFSLGPTAVFDWFSGLPAFGLPALVDLNLAPRISVVGFLGPVFMIGRDTDGTRTNVWLGQAGVGLEMRPLPWLSLRPWMAIAGRTSWGEMVGYGGLAIAFSGQREFP